MARRSAHFDPHVDPRLLKAIEANQLPGYDTEMISGYRAKTPANPKSRHGRGAALDVSLIDQKSGKALGNYHDTPENFGVYQQYANQVYKWAQENDPELAKQLAWGGYFSGGPGKYGSLDLMHFDTGGMQAGGDWQKGLYDQQAKLYGLKPGGGIGDMQASVAPAPQAQAPVGAVGGAGVVPVGTAAGTPARSVGGAGVVPAGTAPLTGGPPTVSHPPNPMVGTGDLDSQGQQDLDIPALGKGRGKNWLEELGAGIGDIKMAPSQISPLQQPAGPARQDADAGITPVAATNPNRMALAQMMLQRLNSGKLF